MREITKVIVVLPLFGLCSPDAHLHELEKSHPHFVQGHFDNFPELEGFHSQARDDLRVLKPESFLSGGSESLCPEKMYLVATTLRRGH